MDGRVANLLVREPPGVLGGDLWFRTPEHSSEVLRLWEEENPGWTFHLVDTPVSTVGAAKDGFRRGLWVDATITAFSIAYGKEAIAPLAPVFRLFAPASSPYCMVDPTGMLASARNKFAVPPAPYTPKPVPRIIWTYWHETDLPPIVEACVQSWKRWNPSFEVRIVNSENVSTYLELPPAMVAWTQKIPQIEADYVRACLLSSYGGVWSDATIACTGPFPVLEEMESGAYEFFGFRQRRPETAILKTPMVENWWFAAPAGSTFMYEWARAFTATITPEQQVDFYHGCGVNSEGIRNVHYFLQHFSAQYVLQKLVTPEYVRDKMRLRVAEEDCGPLWYLHGNTASHAAHKLLTFMRRDDMAFNPRAKTAPEVPVLHKMIKGVRTAMERRGEVDAFVDALVKRSSSPGRA